MILSYFNKICYFENKRRIKEKKHALGDAKGDGEREGERGEIPAKEDGSSVSMPMPETSRLMWGSTGELLKEIKREIRLLFFFSFGIGEGKGGLDGFFKWRPRPNSS